MFPLRTTCHSTDDRTNTLFHRDEHLQLARNNVRYGVAGMHAIGWRAAGERPCFPKALCLSRKGAKKREGQVR